jgi:hypothetical protein
MNEIILVVGVLLIVGGFGLLVWGIREFNPKPRFRRNGGKF